MKKAIKKTALGLTLALTMTTAIACAPADRGATDETGFRGTGVHDDRGTHFGTRGGSGQHGAVGNDTTLNRGYNARGGLFGGTGRNDQGLYGARNNDSTTTNDRALNRSPLGGTIFGGAGSRMNGARTDVDTPRGVINNGNRLGNREQFDDRTGTLGFNNRTGMLNKNNTGFNNGLGAGAYDARRADEMRNRVLSLQGVRDARVVYHDNAVVVAVDTDKNPKNLSRQIRRVLQGDARGEHVYVTTDRNMFNRVGDLDTRWRGGAFGNITDDMGTLLNDLAGTGTAARGFNE